MADLDWLSDRMDDGFDRMAAQHVDILQQLRQMNGRVTEAHIELARHDERLTEQGESLKVVRERTHKIANTIQTQERRLIARDATIVIATAGLVASVMKWGKGWLGLP